MRDPRECRIQDLDAAARDPRGALRGAALRLARRYEGEWADGKIHGRGVLTSAKFKYDGEWRAGKKHGRGVCYYSDGDTYEGDWANDKWHGQGTWVLCGADGKAQERYEGEMFEGKMHGKGAYEYSDGSR